MALPASGALQAWGAAGVDLIIGGHIHLPFVLPLAGGGWAVQAGTAVSSRVRQGAANSVNLIHIDAAASERAVVERWDHDPAQGSFVPRERHRLLAPLRAGGRGPAEQAPGQAPAGGLPACDGGGPARRAAASLRPRCCM